MPQYSKNAWSLSPFNKITFFGLVVPKFHIDGYIIPKPKTGYPSSMVYTIDMAILLRLFTKKVRRKITAIKIKIGEKSIPPILTGIRLRTG